MATGDDVTEALDAFYERSIRPEFDRINERMEAGFGQMDGRLTRFEVRVEQLAAETARRFQEVTDRIDAVRQDLEAFRIQTNDRLADLYGKFQGLQDEYHLIAGALRRIEEEGVPAQRAEMEKLTERLDQVERRLAEVEAKLVRPR
jgi:tetrahydromethanopterin S-methyltransferase subunit G